MLARVHVYYLQGTVAHPIIVSGMDRLSPVSLPQRRIGIKDYVLAQVHAQTSFKGLAGDIAHLMGIEVAVERA
jgi:hypothetical protein